VGANLLKDVDLRLVAELMKNSRRSDRELARALGVSQPTVSRLISRLQKEGVIKEYTMIPDFSKLGFNLMSIITIKLKPLSSGELHELHRAAHELDNQERRPFLLIMEGIGLGKNLAILSLHENYGDYATYINEVKEAAHSNMKPYIDVRDVEGFLIDLNYEGHYQPMTFSKIADNLRAYALKKKNSKEKNE